MKFTRLRLIGFKTFVEPTDVPIEPGLTGVVGPNGCGKSNLVEALRWVMGESSHKAMRANDMDAVIFSGTNSRPARNAAEVLLTVDNASRTAPAAFNEHDVIEVSRRIERDAGSAYRINGREARARDVTLLFADASSGSRSPALVRQGQIAEIINAKPSARRRILEEAAGVAGLHARRHEAEIRLKAAETNLTRLDDVIGQIAGQMDALKRQARQSVRYRNLSAEIRKAEAGLLHLRWSEATRALTAAEAALREAERAVAEKTRLQAEAAKDQAIAAHTLPPLRETEAKAGAALARLSAAREALEREEQRAGHRRDELDRQLAQLAHDIAREKTLAADAHSVLARLEAEEAEVTADRAEHEANALSAGPRLKEAEEALAASETRFAAATAAVADISARRNQLQRTIREHGEKLARLAGQMAGVEADLARMAGDGGDDLEDRRAAVEEAQESLAYAEERVIEAEAAHEAAREAIEAARKPQRDAETQAQRLDAEVRTLTKLLAPTTGDLWPPVLEQLVVAKGYETALGAALGDDLEVSASPSAPVHWGGSAIDPADPALPEGAEPLDRFVEAPEAMARRLRQIGVVGRADGPRLKALLKPGQRLVSLEGDLWRWDGFTAAAHAPTAAARRLAEKNRLGELTETLDEARREAARLKAALDEAETRLRAAASAEAAARDGARVARRGLDAVREALTAAERRSAERAQRLSALAEAKARLSESREEAAAELAEAEAAQLELAATPELDRELDEAKTQLAIDRAALAEVRAEVQTIERERDAAVRRLKAIAEERRQWIERSSGAGARIADIEARRDDTAAERAEFDDLPAQFADQRRALMSEISTAEATRREAADRLAEAESRAGRRRQARPLRFDRDVGRPRGPGALAGAPRPGRGAPHRGGAGHHRGAGLHPGGGLPPRRLQARQAAARPGAAGDRPRPRPQGARAARRGQFARRRGIDRGADPARRPRHRARRSDRGHPAAAHRHRQPQPRGARAARRLVRHRGRPLPHPVREAVRRRRRRAPAHRFGRSAGGRARHPRQAAGQEAAIAVAAVGRRAGADGDGADLRGVPHQSRADLRARRGRRPARRPQCRPFLQSSR